MEIIILRISHAKEKDAVINALTRDGEQTLYVRGLYDPKSKNASLNNNLTIADVEISESKYGCPIVTHTKIIRYPFNINESIQYAMALFAITEATNNLLNENEKAVIFDDLYGTIVTLTEHADPFKVVLTYYTKILKVSGYNMEVNNCVKCGSKEEIVAFSFDEGGFICKNCWSPEIPRIFNKTQMLVIREAFRTKNYCIKNSNISEYDVRTIIHKMCEFIYDSYGYFMHTRELF